MGQASASSAICHHGSACAVVCRQLAAAPKTSVPPPDAARGATADLCDVFHPESVDVVSEPQIQIMSPIFRDLGGKMRFSGQAATGAGLVKPHCRAHPASLHVQAKSHLKCLHRHGDKLQVDQGADAQCMYCCAQCECVLCSEVLREQSSGAPGVLPTTAAFTLLSTTFACTLMIFAHLFCMAGYSHGGALANT